MIENLRKLLAPLRTQVANMVSRAIVKTVDDAKKMQLLQVGLLADETRDEIERVQDYGFTSVPLEGAEAVALFIGGRRDHGLVIKVDDRRYRLKGLEAGEVAMYTDEGDSIVIKRGGTIEINAASDVNVTAAGNVNLNGGGADAAHAVARKGSITAGHTHTIVGTAGPYPINATIQTATDTIDSNVSSNVKVP